MRTGIEKYQQDEFAGTASQIRSLTLTENLESRKASLEHQLERVNEAIAALKASPEVEKIINLISQV